MLTGGRWIEAHNANSPASHQRELIPDRAGHQLHSEGLYHTPAKCLFFPVLVLSLGDLGGGMGHSKAGASSPGVHLSIPQGDQSSDHLLLRIRLLFLSLPPTTEHAPALSNESI